MTLSSPRGKKTSLCFLGSWERYGQAGEPSASCLLVLLVHFCRVLC